MAKVVLVGYGQMLYSLIEGIEKTSHKILGVFRADRIKTNSIELFIKDVFMPSLDYSVIKSKKLYDIKGESVNSEKFLKEIKKLKPDLIVVGSWGELFKDEILNTIPCINFHPALLPKNRGANPYFWVIYQNQSVTGLTVHFMDKKFDRGDIIAQVAITIDENETGTTLKNKTCALAKVMTAEVLDLFDKGQIQPIVQNEEFATYERQLTFRETIIDLTKPKTDVDRHLRALTPWAKPVVKIAHRYVEFLNYDFIEVDENTLNKKPYDVIEHNSKYFILKGSDFLIKIYK